MRALRNTGIDAIGCVPWGTHICVFYHSVEELLNLIAPFLRAGLDENEFCLWIPPAEMDFHQASAILRKLLPNFEVCVKRGQLEILSHTEWYLSEGVFNQDKVLTAGFHKLNQAMAIGFEGLRAVGDIGWVEKKDWRHLLNYEEKVNEAAKNSSMIAVCTYPLQRGGAAEVIEAVLHHPFVLLRRDDRWELVENLERHQTMEALRQSQARFHELFDNAPVGYHELDTDGRIVRVNRTELDMLGYTAKEMLGRYVWEFVADQKTSREMTLAKLSGKIPPGHVFERNYKRKDGTLLPVLIEDRVLRDPSGKITGIRSTLQDITERKQAEAQILRQNALLSGINRVLQETLTCESESDVARVCLRVAEELTGSKFGWIGEINPAGRLDTIAQSDPGWSQCRMPASTAAEMIRNMEIRGIWGRVLKDERSLIVNDPATHPDRVGTPPGHPPIHAFLGVPLKQAGKTIGMIALANKEGGYEFTDQQDIETLSVAFVEALRRKRAEARIHLLNTLLRTIAEINQMMVREHDQQRVLSETCRILVEYGKFCMAAVTRADFKTGEVHPLAHVGFKGDFLERFGVRCDDTPKGRCPTGAAIRTGRVVICNDTETEESLAPWIDMIRQQGYRSLAAFPLRVRGQIFGAITVYSEKPHSIGPEMATLLGELADDVGFALEAADERAHRKLAEDALRLTQFSIDRASDPVYWVGPDARFIYVNDAACRALGYTRQELLTMTVHDIDPDYQPDIWPKHWEELKQRGHFTFETRHRTKDGRIFPVEITVNYLEFGGKEYNFAFARDISQRKQAEAALRLNEARLEALVKLSQMTDASFQELADFALEEGVRLTGSTIGYLAFLNEDETVLTMHAWSKNALKACAIPDKPLVYPVATTGLWGEAVRQRRPIITNDYQAPNPLKKGYPHGHVPIFRHMNIPVFEGNRIVAVAGVGNKQDEYNESDVRQLTLLMDGMWKILQRRRAAEILRAQEEELFRAKKMESIGVLAGGIAHDFNNLLSVILGNISLARLRAQSGNTARALERLAEAEKACARARELTQQLLTFSRGGAPVKQVASLAEVLRETTTFVLHGSKVRCEFSIPDDLRPVEIDPGQISQVIHNIIINAAQAMPHGGIVQVQAENIDVGPSSALPLSRGQYVKVSIRDCGPGIPKDHLHKIFDPYFTTKPSGTGLGLSTAYSIIRRHEGYITAESQEGEGTTIIFYLPASSKQIAPKEKPPEPQPTPGHGKILVMDDEKMIRDMLVDMLAQLGYTAEQAKDGAEALHLYKSAMESGNPFHAVIMDLTVPGGMGGKEAIKKLLEIDPQAKAIVSSGYSDDPIMSEYLQYGFVGVIAKPYMVEDLSKILHSVIKKGA